MIAKFFRHSPVELGILALRRQHSKASALAPSHQNPDARAAHMNMANAIHSALETALELEPRSCVFGEMVEPSKHPSTEARDSQDIYQFFRAPAFAFPYSWYESPAQVFQHALERTGIVLHS
eukprot:1156632-Pelagomonas_calceolata.AAC.6